MQLQPRIGRINQAYCSIASKNEVIIRWVRDRLKRLERVIGKLEKLLSRVNFTNADLKTWRLIKKLYHEWNW